jgi:hypothetical protein
MSHKKFSHVCSYNAFLAPLKLDKMFLVASVASIDLTQSWSPSTVIPYWTAYPGHGNSDISTTQSRSPPALIPYIGPYPGPDDSDISTTRRPYLWYDPFSELVYKWGGWAFNGNNTQSSILYAFNPSETGNATFMNVSSSAYTGLSQDNYAPFGAAFTSTEEAFYMFSGAIAVAEDVTDFTPRFAIQGLTVHNFSTST